MAARRRNVGIVVFCIVLATLLWGYVTLTRTYEDYISVPFSVQTPRSVALLSTVPDRVTVRVRGTGWQLLNMRLVANTNTNVLDLGLLRADDAMTYRVSKADILRAIMATPGSQVLDVSPGSLTLATGEVSTRRVPIRLRSAIRCRDGFMVIGTPRLQPATVELRGSASVIQAIREWPTELFVIDDQHQGAVFTVRLSDSLSTLLSVNPSSVRVITDVQQMADVVIDNVPVEARLVTRNGDVTIRPQTISVIVKGGVSDLAGLTPQLFHAYVDDSTALRTGLTRPVVTGPSSVIIVGTIPRIVQITTRTAPLR